MKKKKKLILIIIIAVVVLAAAFVVLMLTGILPFGGGGEEPASGVTPMSGSMAASGVAPMSGSMAASGVAPMSGSMTSSGSMVTSGSMASAGSMAASPNANPERFFQGEYYFQNITGNTLVEIQLAPSGTDSFENNLLGDTPLENGQTWLIPLMMRDLGGTWDLRTTDSNGQELLFTGLDFYANSKFVLTLDGTNTSLRQAP